MSQIKKILKKQISLPPALIVFAGIIIIMMITAIGGIAHYNAEVSQKLSSLDSQTAHIKKTTLGPVEQNSNYPDSQSKTTRDNAGRVSIIKTDGSVIYEGSSTESTQPARTPDNSYPTKPTVSQNISVNLSINGSFNGYVSVKSGSTQCQVLNAALSQNIISSLDMRKNSQIGSYAVYKINGIGDPKDVWWVYTVNGHEVQGCSFVGVKNGDNINWKYLKN